MCKLQDQDLVTQTDLMELTDLMWLIAHPAHRCGL
jgi:hypothetical protein